MKKRIQKNISWLLCLMLLITVLPCSALAGFGGGGGGGGDPGSGGGSGSTLSVAYDANGATAGTAPAAASYASGATVTVADPGTLVKTGSVFAGWNTKADGSGTTYCTGATFAMPSSAVTLYAVWVPKQISYQPADWPQRDSNANVAYSTSDGKNTIVPTSYYKTTAGAVLYKTPVTGKYAAKSNFVGFDDIVATYWASEYIWFLSARNVVNGIGDNLYAPDQNVTRASFVKMLACITPGVDLAAIPSAVFPDVAGTDWFAPYVNWAVANKIASGYSNGNFGPKDPITREQMCKMIAAYVAYVGYDLGSVNTSAAFADQSSISAWAAESVSMLQKSGLITGTDNVFNPQGLSTRATAATVVCRLLMGILSALNNPSSIPLS